MMRIFFGRLRRFSSLHRITLIATITLAIASDVPAQIEDYRLFQQQQQTPPQQAPVNPIPVYCAQPENSTLPECAEIQADQQGQYPSPTQQQTPLNIQRNRTPYFTNAPPVTENYPETTPARAIPPSYRITEPATEFQRFVQSFTGRLLPIYGTWLFDHVPSTFAPVDRIPVTPDYVIGPGDEIDLRIWGQINSNQRLTVDRAGDIFLPQAGSVHVAGLKFSQLQDAIKATIGRVYKNFDLNVNMGQLRSIQIFVVGQARRPGNYTVSSLSTLVNALFASGGPSSHGSLRNIQLKRGGTLITSFDLYDLLLHGDKSKDVPLLPGDVLFIPPAGPRVAVTGSVEYPAIYELRNTTSLEQILQFSGGLSPVAAGQRAVIERIHEHNGLRTESVELTPQGLASSVQNGDIVRLLPVVPRFTKTVTLRGNIADPGRFPWHEGMKLSDLIPNKESLLTRDYWRERNQLVTVTNQNAQPTEEFLSSDESAAGSARRVGASNSTPNTVTSRRNFREEERNTTADTSLAAAQSGSNAAPIRQFSPQNDVQPVAADIDWNYAVIERRDPQTLATRLIPFHPGRAIIDHDPSADVPLEPGDVITIFSEADVSVPDSQKTKYVRIEGEVKFAGIYSVHPGETLRQLVARAGGFTSNAYLYGAQFTRESTRREQQRRYNDFLNQLERDIDQNSANLSGRVVSAEQAASSQASLAGQRSLVEQLRKVPVSGRVVIPLEPNSSGVDSLPDLALENGDRLFIPSRPSTVNVIGTVYNQATFLYASDLRLGDYLKDAGGPTRFADRNHLFIMRADGSVVAKKGHSRLFARDFDSLPMYPGDSLVVPTDVTKTTFLRGLIDWSQVISNFGLGAAAINVLR